MVRHTYKPDFDGYHVSAYSTFRAWFFMIDFIDVDRPGVWFVHILFCMVCGILLMNYLIAVLSTTYAHVEDHSRIFVWLHRLSVVVVTDSRMGLIFGRMRKKILKRFLL